MNDKKCLLVTGGSRSGKSSYAEKRLSDLTSILYIATALPVDEEMKERIRIHQERRGPRYVTLECHRNLAERIKEAPQESVMLECMGTWVTNRMFDLMGDDTELRPDKVRQIEEILFEECRQIIAVMKEKKGMKVVITNEVGMSIVSEYPLGRAFTDILGRLNQWIAEQMDEVVLMVCGIPMFIKK